MKRYKVTGSQPVLNNRMPGETFDDVIEPSLERFLLGIGAIEIISHDVEADKRIQSGGGKRPSKGKG